MLQRIPEVDSKLLLRDHREGVIVREHNGVGEARLRRDVQESVRQPAGLRSGGNAGPPGRTLVFRTGPSWPQTKQILDGRLSMVAGIEASSWRPS